MEFKSIIVIIILFLSVLITSWNFDLKAKSLDNEMNSTLNSRSNHRLNDENFDWGEIEVISEPIASKSFNTEPSESPKITVENDKIYVVWRDYNDTNGAGGDDWDIFFRFFNGSKWSKIQVISELVVGQNFHTGYSYIPDIAVENGKIYVVWSDNNNTNGAGGDNDIFYRCNLTGSGWEDIEVISEPVQEKNFNTGDSRAPSIAVENGKIYVFWSDDNNTNGAGGDNDIFYRCNLTGSGWEDIEVISEPVQGKNFNTGMSGYYTGPEIAVEDSKIYVVWSDNNNTNNADIDGDIFYRCNLVGSSWEPIQVISEPVLGQNFSTGSSRSPAVAVENGKIYVVWVDTNNTNGAGTDTDIFYRCNITGKSWEPVQVISEPISCQNSNIDWSDSPEIAVEDGKIYIVWADSNNTNSAGLDYDIFYRCNFTGTSWENIWVISEPCVNKNFNTGSSNKPHIAVNHGNSHIVWVDENDTNGGGTDGDIFYRSISLILGLGPSTITPISGNTSTNFIFKVTYFHFSNTPPTEITVNISGTEYSMLEVDPADTNYLDDKDYFFNIKNLNIGVHTCQFYASDSKFTKFTALVNKPIVYNTPPGITTKDNLTAFEDVYYEVDYEYEDIDFENIGQLGTWNFSTNASWLSFNPTTAILNGTPTNDDVDEYWVNITIDDTIDFDCTNFTLIVINVNDAPVITTNDIVIINEDQYYEVEYQATDIDTLQENLEWDMNTNASWLEFESINTVLNGTPCNDDVGTYWVNVSVSDIEYVDFTNFTLIVLGINDGPKIITENIITATEDEYYEVDYEAEDVDNAQSKLTWTIDTNAEWLTYDTKTAIINGTPENNDVGEYWVYISVSDMEYIDFTNFTLTVLNTNDPPVIITEDKTSAIVSELYSVNYEAEDIDPPPVTLTWSLKSNASDWLTIDATTGWLNGKPSQNDVGSYWVNVSIWDGENGWDYSNFTLYVTKEPEYGDEDFKLSGPKMTPTDGDTETEFTFSIHYYNSENKAPTSIQLIVDGNVYNMTLKPGENTSNGTYECKLKLSEGIHTYYFTASNGTETVKTDNFATPYIEKVGTPPKEESTWYWLIWLIIILIIIASLIFLAIYKKRKAAKIPTVRAELLYKPPEHIALPGVTSGVEGARALPPQPTIIEQLPTLKVPVPSLAPPPVKPLLQLPQATLTKVQQLNLLRERLLRGEISEETYKELKAEIEGSTEKDITKEDTEDEQPLAMEQSPPEEQSIAEPAKPEPQEPVVEQPPQEQSESEVTPQVDQPPQPQVEVQQPVVEQSPAEPAPQAPVPKAIEPEKHSDQTIPKIEDSED